MAVSDRLDDILVTYSLGSCVGVTLYDPEVQVGGLVHCMMPSSMIDLVKAVSNPCAFVDTGTGALIQAVFDLGGQRSRLIAKVIGAATQFHGRIRSTVGDRNYAAVREILRKHGILIAGEDVGGDVPRSVFLHMDTGMTVVRSGGREKTI